MLSKNVWRVCCAHPGGSQKDMHVHAAVCNYLQGNNLSMQWVTNATYAQYVYKICNDVNKQGIW